jgi:hypothetical protein
MKLLFNWHVDRHTLVATPLQMDPLTQKNVVVRPKPLQRSSGSASLRSRCLPLFHSSVAEVTSICVVESGGRIWAKFKETMIVKDVNGFGNTGTVNQYLESPNIPTWPSYITVFRITVRILPKNILVFVERSVWYREFRKQNRGVLGKEFWEGLGLLT